MSALNIICDVDNVISDDAWRRSFIGPRTADPRNRFHEYHVASAMDSAHNLDLLLVPNATVILLTAMPEEYASLRRDWLSRNGVHWHRIMFRKDGDHRPSVEVKQDMIADLILERVVTANDNNIAYDDNQEIVDMYGRFGLHARRIAINEAVPYPTLNRSAIEEARAIVYGNRQTVYGDPLPGYRRLAALWSAALGVEVTPQRVVLCLILMKVSRELNGHAWDNIVDIAGYAENLGRIMETLNVNGHSQTQSPDPTSAEGRSAILADADGPGVCRVLDEANKEVTL